MGGFTYTLDQLHSLRESPLVQKPDGLPSIEQWMDLPADHNNNTSVNNNNNSNNSNRRSRTGHPGEVAVTGENRTDRPLLINAGGMGHFGRRSSTQPEDTVLGPPKLSFTSASRAAKTADNTEKRALAALDGDQLGDRFPARRNDRWTRDREGEGNREKAGFPNGRRAAREDGEGWTNVKGRKSLGQEDFDRGFGRNGDREKAHKESEVDNAEGAVRRTGTARERWGRRDEGNAKEGEGSRFTGVGQGGWRDRERDRDREWNRGGNRVEEDPEWMETHVTKEKKQAHTQEEFQRWKEQMRAKDTPTVDTEEPKPEAPAPAQRPGPTNIAIHPPSKPAATPPAAEANQGILFGNWGKDKLADVNASAAEVGTAKAKPDKKSRFMTMFTKPEEPTAPTSQPPLPTPASPAPPPGANGSNDEDKQGFQRILQMLGGAAISTPQGPPPGIPTPTNGVRQGGIPLDRQPQLSDEQLENRPPRQQTLRTLEQQSMLDNILAPRPTVPETRPSQARFNTMSPDNALLEQLGFPRPDSHRPGDEYSGQQPPSRNSSAHDAPLHTLLNSRAREDTSRDPQTKRERDFLLTLMQQPRATPPQQMNQNIPRGAPENQSTAFFDQGVQRSQGHPKGRGGGGPPGFMEDPRFLAENEIMLRREQQIRELQQQQQQEAMRAKNPPRLPMGFNPPHDDPNIASMQRRNTAGEVPRQMTNMGIPSQGIPDLQFTGGRQPGMPPTPQERPNIAPPPGFGGPGGMRQPPGFGGPQQMPSFSAGNTPLHPPGFGPPPGVRGAIFPGGPGQNPMSQGPPQGYFPPPPGYAPPMGLRGAEDPRMMMGRPEFDQFGGPGPRQAGRPPNMY